MSKILTLAFSLTVLSTPFAIIDGSGSAAEARLKYTQNKCTKNHATGMTSCTTIVWYTN